MKLSNLKNVALSAVVVASIVGSTTEAKADAATVLAAAGAGFASLVGYEYGKEACNTPAPTSYNVQVVPSAQVPGTVATAYTMNTVSIPVVKETVVIEKPVVVEKYVPVYIKQKQSPTVIFY
jgi:hypothetical protein